MAAKKTTYGDKLHTALRRCRKCSLKIPVQAKDNWSFDFPVCEKLVACKSSEEFVSTINCLINHGLNILATDENDTTLLHFLAKSVSDKKSESAKYLVDKGVDINEQENLQYNTAVHFAVSCEDPDLDLIHKLAENGACLNVLNANDATPLSIALKHWNNLDVCMLLIIHGAQPRVPTVYETLLWLFPLENICTEDFINLLLDTGLYKMCLCRYHTAKRFPYSDEDPPEHTLASSSLKCSHFTFPREVEIILRSRVKQPKRLLDIVRIKIRSALSGAAKGCSILRPIASLEIPQLLKGFMSFDYEINMILMKTNL